MAQRQSAGLRLTTLLLSVAILVVGNGLAGTLLGVRAGLEGMRAESIGLLMSGYFFGFVVASRFVPCLIWSVGHIRAFAAMASVASAVAVAYAIFVSPIAWLLLRLLHGACYAGLTVVIESWLNGSTTRRHRGRVLATYNVVLMGSWSVSQPLLQIADPSGFILFCVVSICMSLALVPITLTRSGVPGMSHMSRSSVRRLFEISPLGLAGALTPGLAMSALFGMGPTFAQRLGLDESGISTFMAVTIGGALVFQWPLGWLSDFVDRRLVLILGGAIGSVAAGIIAVAASALAYETLLVLAFCFGGATIPLYSLAVAHLNDRIEATELVTAASGLVTVYGVGAAIGPFAASVVMGQMGPRGLFGFSGSVLFLFLLFALFRLARTEAVARVAKQAFVATPRTSGVALQLHKHRRGPTPGRRGPA